MLSCLRPTHHLPIRRFFSRSAAAPDIERYRESFAGRMAMAGIKPHHRIALGVSGGPDSMALCVLTAGWKSSGLTGERESSGFVDGLLGIVVDHRLRPESTEEANLVRERVLKMGIQCNIASCDWSDGRPKLGHLQEAAREMRWVSCPVSMFKQFIASQDEARRQILTAGIQFVLVNYVALYFALNGSENVCNEQKIGVLLVAHHSDDQAELFVLRLSRNSGVLGLAGMAFASQLFPTHPHSHGQVSSNNGLLLVRPMLNLSKDDMYKICQGGFQEWVEDPSNQSPTFARNRIRISLRNLMSDTFRSELQALISACRLTRTYTEQICCSLIQQCVTVVDHGYSIIDLNKLNPSNVEDVCLSKLLAVLLQFVSQRHRPVRGGVSNLLLDYIRNIPCKTSLTAAGCYLCAVPKSKGTKIMISVSLESPQPSGTEISHKHSREGSCSLNEINEIMMVAKLYSGKSLDASDVPFLKATSSETVLKEAKELNIISESTYNSILLLKMEECKNFNAKTELKSDPEMRQKMESTSISRIQLHPGQSCHFMNRFLVTWECCEKTMQDIITPTDLDCNSKDAIMHCICGPCMIGHETASIRHMVDTDWTYLANMSKNHTPDFQGTLFSSAEEKEKNAVKTTCSNYVQLSAQGALQVLKSIPVPARRSLPVLVDSQDALLCIPSMQFQRWPDLLVTARFVPRVPLGGGFSSFL